MNITDLPRNMQNKIWRAESGCWEWVGARNSQGYGAVGVLGKSKSTHRVAWTLLVAPIPWSMTIDHATCRNRPCCNVAHLEVVTARENTHRAASTRYLYCRSGHKYVDKRIRVADKHAFNGYQEQIVRQPCSLCPDAAELHRRKALVKRLGPAAWTELDPASAPQPTWRLRAASA